MQVNILFFASMADKTGTKKWTTALPAESTVDDVRKMLTERFPSGAELLSVCHVAVNQEYAKGNPALKHSDEIAFFPPVSGG